MVLPFSQGIVSGEMFVWLHSMNQVMIYCIGVGNSGGPVVDPGFGQGGARTFF